MSDFGKNLKELRLSRDLTQDQLSERLKVSKSRISMYENGNRRPSFEMLETISDFFNVDMNILLGDDSSSSAPAPDPDEEHLLQIYRKLNVIGRRKAIERVEELTEIERYIKIEVGQSDAV